MKPASFKFSGFDLTWPQTTIVAMDGPEKQRIEVENLSDSLPTAGFDGEKYLREAGFSGQRSNEVLAGRNAIIVASDQKAGMALLDHGNVWVLTASGREPEKLLEKVASSVVLKH